MASGRGYPLMLMNRYSRGVLYIWTIPENFNDLYRLPSPVTSAIKDRVMAGFPVRLDGPSQVALFAYDNDTFIVESYRHAESDVTVSLLNREFAKLRNLVTDEVIAAEAEPRGEGAGRRGGRGNRYVRGEHRVTFNLHLPPHSYLVFAAEK